MSKVDNLKKNLQRGTVYRRSDLTQWSNAVDRHVSTLVKDGTLQKLSAGLYYYPNESVFGSTPPDEKNLIRSFLKDDYFLLTSPNDYNSLSVGTTQLYNTQVVYNHKRHGEFKLGGKTYLFFAKHRFPKKATTEFLLIDLLNNLSKLAEDREIILNNVLSKLKTFDLRKLKGAMKAFGSAHTKSLLTKFILKTEEQHAS